MPVRHVRFASADTFHSPPPTSHPSPQSAPISFPVSPRTPPSVSYAEHPGPTPLPRRRFHSDATVAGRKAHDYISFSTKPLIKYDVSLHPSSLSARNTSLSAAGFMEPAVYPPRPFILLVTPYLPWTIGVPASNSEHVTVFDVLSSIYHTLRVSATQGEFHTLGSQKLMRRVSAAYTQRYERLDGHHGYNEEKRQGIKRVDFLMGYTRLEGISPTAGAPNVWRLHSA